MNKKMLDILNEQINKEVYSAYLYLSMNAYLASKNLPGFANYMRVQYQEEMSHALKLFDYLLERGEKAILAEVAAVKVAWMDPIDVFEDTYEHEKFITRSIDEVLGVAHEVKDYATINMLQWYINEQVEEEANVSSILEQLKMIEGKGTGLFMLDREMQNRVFVDSTQANV
ncbi:MAG: ferritin [Fusobacteriia bacterium 4572_74]|nr:MAG: ferritin [Fusobacteriia bacterium 4572_74]